MKPNVVPASVDMDRKRTSGSRVIPAPPEAIFELLADPAKHSLLDGSGTVHANRSSNPNRLSKGGKFRMAMRFGPLPYRVSNTMSEFVEPSVIEWHHFGRHRWRYELERVEGGTKVTETFDWGQSILPAIGYEVVGYPERHRHNIDATLQRLEQYFSELP